MKAFYKNEKGYLEIEGMIIMIFLMFILTFLMSIGFILYQKWMVLNVANDTAARIAQGWIYPDTDPILNYIDEERIVSVPLFRSGQDFQQENQVKAQNTARWQMGLSSLAIKLQEPEVAAEIFVDAMGREHVEVSITARYQMPMGGFLRYFGMNDVITFQETGRAQCIDLLGYVSGVDTVAAVPKMLTDTSDVVGVVDSAWSLISKIMDVFSKE